QAPPIGKGGGHQVRITRTLVCRSAGGLCSGSKSTLPHEVEGAPLMRLIGCAVLIGSVLAIAPTQAQLSGHGGPIRALAISADGAALAAASWERTIRLWPLAGGVPQVFEGHSQSVNGVAFAPDGTKLVSAGYDAALRVWPLRGSDAPLVATLASPLNAVAVAP